MRNRPPARRPASPPLHDLDPESALSAPTSKRRYVNAVFDAVAPKYDQFTRLFSFGMDARWKRRLARWVVEVIRPGDVVLDLACGSGDIGRGIGRASGQAGGRAVRVLGMDANREMLRLAKHRLHELDQYPGNAARRPARLCLSDMMALPVPDASVHAVTVGYGFRNTPDPAGAVAEVARVLVPGGWLFDLDFFLPEFRIWRRLYLWYLRRAGRLVGHVWHAEPETYGYIARSVERWLTSSAFAALLRKAGFDVVRSEARLGGGIVLHAARLRNVSHPIAT
jgi:demethylmenaquinone methyltransferase/2-methoxy-6-polyprenyl-1,4-benzoquinol methylase